MNYRSQWLCLSLLLSALAVADNPPAPAPPMSATPTATQSSSPPAPIYGLDEPGRVPDRWLVVLKESLPWQHKANEPRVLTGDAATDAANERNLQARMAADGVTMRQIGNELAAQDGAYVLGEIHGVLHSFTMTMSEDAVRQMTQDPRIDHITADHVLKFKMAGSPP